MDLICGTMKIVNFCLNLLIIAEVINIFNSARNQKKQKFIFIFEMINYVNNQVNKECYQLVLCESGIILIPQIIQFNNVI